MGDYGYSDASESNEGYDAEWTSESVESDNVAELSESDLAMAFGENTSEGGNTEIIESGNNAESSYSDVHGELSGNSLRDITLTQEQSDIINDMEQKGEMDVNPEQWGETIVGGSNVRLAETHVDMPYNENAQYGSDVFKEQVNDQEAGLNQMTVKEFLENYEARQEFGRSDEGTKEQAQYNDGLKVSLIDDKMQEGKSFEQAEKEATAELSGKAALHNPDQVAGGNPRVISAKGDSSVNSALGSLWEHGRAASLYDNISEMSKNMTEEEKANTYLNVRIDAHPR